MPPLRKFYLFLGKLFTVIFAILFVITTTLLLILFGPYRLLNNPALYKNALSDLDVYGKIPAIVSNLLPSSILIDPCGERPDPCGNIPAENRLPSYSINLTPKNWQVLFEILLTPEEIKTIAESNLDVLFAFLPSNNNQIIVSMGKLKENIKGITEEASLQLFFSSLPFCSEAGAPEISVTIPTIVNVRLCKSDEESSIPQNENFRHQFELFIDKIPDGIALSMPSATLKEIRRGINFTSLLPLLPLPFLLGVTLLGVRSIKNGMRTLGILFFLSGLLALAAGLICRSGEKAILSLVPGLVNFPSPISELIHDLGRYLLNHLTDWIIYSALIIFIIGLTTWISSALIWKNTKESASFPPDALRRHHD